MSYIILCLIYLKLIIKKKLTNIKKLIFYVLDYFIDTSCSIQDVVRWFVFVDKPIKEMVGVAVTVVAVAAVVTTIAVVAVVVDVAVVVAAVAVAAVGVLVVGVSCHV